MRIFEVAPDVRGCWLVRGRERAQPALSVHNSKDDAVKSACRAADVSRPAKVLVLNAASQMPETAFCY